MPAESKALYGILILLGVPAGCLRQAQNYDTGAERAVGADERNSSPQDMYRMYQTRTDSFRLDIAFLTADEKAGGDLVLYVRPDEYGVDHRTSARISQQAAARLVDELKRQGFFDRASDVSDIDEESPRGPWVRLHSKARDCPRLEEYLDWGLEPLRRLRELRAVLDGGAGTLMDQFLTALGKAIEGETD